MLVGFLRTKCSFHCKILRRGQRNIAHIQKEHLTGLMFHQHMLETLVQMNREILSLYDYGRGVSQRNLLLWTPLKSKGEGMGPILFSHIRILSKMLFPQRPERCEVGRASQVSRDIPPLSPGLHEALSSAKGGSPASGPLPAWPSGDTQGHGQCSD